MKTMLKGTALLFVCVVAVACSHDMFDENRINDDVKTAYRTAFEKKYGTISSNQTWDFTNLSGSSMARTRANQSVSWTRINLNNGFWSFIDEDANDVHTKIASADILEWNHALAVELYPCYAHGYGVNKDQFFHLAIVDKDVTYSYSNNTITSIDVIGNIKTKDDKWYGAGKALIHDSGRTIQAKNIYKENKIWVAYFTWVDNYSNATKKENANNMANIQNFEIKNYKEIVVNNHTYWCFDCNGDNDYSDLVCLVRNVDPVKPIEKRYMVEDLGGDSDFDFNDIVVDVVEDAAGNQKAYVRAMGGTKDFTLQIGNTKWTKEIDGGFNPATIYNTLPTIQRDKVLAEFTVTGWKPESNNISVTVQNKLSNDVIIVIPFPRQGDVPMIIAVDPITTWNEEYEELRDDWWSYPAVTE